MKRWWNAHPRWADLTAALTTALISVVAAIRVFGLPVDRLSALWSPSVQGEWITGDLNFAYGGAKTIALTGWLGQNDFLGFPFSQDYSHFPNTDLLNLLELKFLLALGFDPIATTNLNFVISFPLVAFAAFYALRFIGVSRLISWILSVSFALLPWHYLRITHQPLANYWILGASLVWLAIVIGLRSPTFFARHKYLLLGLGVILGIAQGLHSSYYAVFWLILAGTFGVLRFRKTDSPLALWQRSLVFVATPIAMVAMIKIIASGRYIPAIVDTTARTIDQQYNYAGHLASLFVIDGNSLLAGNPINGLLSNALSNPYPTGLGEGIAHLSALAVLGIVLAFLLVLFLLSGSTLSSARACRPFARVSRPWLGIFILAILFFTATGFGLLFGALATTQVRAWGRLTIVIVLIAFVILGLAATALMRNRIKNRRMSLLLKFGTVGILVLLLLDGLTFRGQIYADTTLMPQLRSYTARADALLGPSCPILNLPRVSFPENVSETETSTYDQYLPFLASANRAYSFGQFEGQLGALWQQSLSSDPTTLTATAKALGFCGIEVDQAALKDPGSVIAGLTSVLGTPIATAADRWSLFSLERIAGTFADGDPRRAADVRFVKGFTGAGTTGLHEATAFLPGNSGTLRIGNPSDSATRVSGDITFGLPGCAPDASIVVTSAAGESRLELKSGQETELPLDLAMNPQEIKTFALTGSPTVCTDDPNLPGGIRVTVSTH